MNKAHRKNLAHSIQLFFAFVSLLALSASAVAAPIRTLRHNCPVRPGDSIFPTAVTNTGMIGGFFQGIPAAGSTDPIYGFTLSPNGKCTVFRYPGAVSTWILDMNDRGELLVNAQLPGNSLFVVYKDGKFIPLQSPGVSWGWRPTGIGGSGEVAGGYYGGTDGNGETLGFVFSEKGFLSLRYPKADAGYLGGITSVSGVSSNGTLVGESILDVSQSEGFSYKDGVFSTVAYPGALSTSPIDVNDHGSMVGTFQTERGGGVFTLTDGVFKSLDIANAYLYPTSINNEGTIVGTIARTRKDGEIIIKPFVLKRRTKR